MLIKKTRIPVHQMTTIGMLPSRLKITYYRLRGYNIEKGVSIGLGSIIVAKDVHIQEGVKIGFLTVVRGREIKIGRFSRIGSMCFIDTHKIEIGEDTRINENVIIGGIKFPDSSIMIGDRSIVMEYSYLNPSRPIRIGDNTGIGGHCFLFTHGSWSSQLEGYPVTFASINLGNDVWLPWRVFIMPGVEIGDGSVIGANSLVARSLPAHSLAAGSPAKIIKEDYPEKPGEGKVQSMAVEMIGGFTSYLESENFIVVAEYPNDGPWPIKLNVSRKKRRYDIAFSLNPNVNTLTSNTCVYVNGEDVFSRTLSTEKMTISLSPAMRGGSTAIGEEFLSYISRFGIRCKRMD